MRDSIKVELKISKELHREYKKLAKACGVSVRNFMQVVLFLQIAPLKRQLEEIEQSTAERKMHEAKKRLDEDGK